MNMIQAVVVNGRIEFKAPPELQDGDTVSVLVLENSSSAEPMTDQEITNSLRVLDEFNSQFPTQEQGEDLSAVARQAGEQEKLVFPAAVEKIERLFD